MNDVLLIIFAVIGSLVFIPPLTAILIKYFDWIGNKFGILEEGDGV